MEEWKGGRMEGRIIAFKDSNEAQFLQRSTYGTTFQYSNIPMGFIMYNKKNITTIKEGGFLMIIKI